MSAIDKIVKNSGQKPTPAAQERQDKEKRDEIVKELVKDQAPVAEKRKPGRPRSNSTEKQPKSPRSSSSNIELPMQPPKTGSAAQIPGQSPIDQIRNRLVISSLQMYVRKFPEVIGKSLDGYNPHLHTPEENRKIIEEIKQSVRNDGDMESMPAITSTILDNTERGALYYAVTNPTHPAATYILDLQGISEALQRDPVIGREIALAECEMMDLVPKHPAIRIAIGLLRVVTNVMTSNRKRRAYAMQSGSAIDPDPEKYKDL